MAAAQSWVQVEARPTLPEARDRAAAYDSAFSNVEGYWLRSGWFAIVLGPFANSDEAQRVRDTLQQDRIIPPDSFVADGREFRQKYWPSGVRAGAAVRTPTPLPQTAPAAPTPQTPAIALDETPAQARASERALSRTEREALQTALQWFGFYDAAIDGSFGRGTRRSMGAWQAENGSDPTGILTAKQRAFLLAAFDAALAALNLQTVTDAKAGISLTMPTGLVQFEGYDYPFARYGAKSGSEVELLLISQPGTRTTLGGLYEIMQTLEIVPLEGERQLGRDSFTLRGSNAELESYSFARLSGGEIKGFALVYPPARSAEMARIIDIMQRSFTPIPGSLQPTDLNAEAQSVDLLAGLELRRPKLSRSGFYVDPTGAVITTANAVASCTRITLDEQHEMQVAARTGDLALLTPVAPLVPLNYARFATRPPVIRTPVAVSGFSYEGVLGAPTVTFGTLADIRDLSGDTARSRLEAETLTGDAGGPVLDASGGVSGLLLPTPTSGRALPEATALALKSSQIVSFLAENGITPAAARGGSALATEDLVATATDMTVLVGCW